MLTLFTTAKPFKGHDGIIQRNALQSWKLLHSDVEVILFGDDEGAAEVCAEYGLRHEPHVERHESGAKRLNYIFKRAQEISRHDCLCYSNCDIVLMSDFWRAFEKVRSWEKHFLLVAQRWDIDITEPIQFSDPTWAEKLKQLTLSKGFQQGEFWIDLFLFPRGLYLDMPPLIVGHCYWDNWMIWKALQQRVSVLDATAFVMPIHQNHGYNPKFARTKGVGSDPLSLVNLELAGGRPRIRHIKSSTHVLACNGQIRLNLGRFTYKFTHPAGRILRPLRYRVWLPVWHFLLDFTRPLRTALGLRSKAMRQRT